MADHVPDGRVLPCTYRPDRRLTLSDLTKLGGGMLETEEFQAARRAPGVCAGCVCRGGCAGRRALGRLDAPTLYCPFARGDVLRIDSELAGSYDVPRLRTACTTVASAR